MRRLWRPIAVLCAGAVLVWGCRRETIGLGAVPRDASAGAPDIEEPAPQYDAGKMVATPGPTRSPPVTRPPQPIGFPPHDWSRDAGEPKTRPPTTEHPVPEEIDAGHVECRSNTDCDPNTAPFCRTDIGKCVKCLSDLLYCGSIGLHCDPLTNECVCTSNLDCRSSTNLCDSVSRQCVLGCSSTTGCQQYFFTPICDMARNVCVQCLDASDCKGKTLITTPIEICRAGFCVECSEEADCTGTRKHCELHEGVCVECLKSSHCPSGDTCVNQQCRPQP